MVSSVSNNVNAMANRYQYKGGASAYVLVDGGTISLVGSQLVVTVSGGGSGSVTFHTRTIDGQTIRYLGTQ